MLELSSNVNERKPLSTGCHWGAAGRSSGRSSGAARRTCSNCATCYWTLTATTTTTTSIVHRFNISATARNSTR